MSHSRARRACAETEHEHQDHRDSAHRPILGSGFAITTDNDFARFEIQVAPFDLRSLAGPASRERETAKKISAIARAPRARVFDRLDQFQELVPARQCQLLFGAPVTAPGSPLDCRK